MVPRPAPQTCTTFTTFTTFAKFAIFANFATFDSALERPTPLHRHAPRLGSISERAFPASHPPLLSSTGEGGQGGEGRPGQGGEGKPWAKGS
jgi:hypothetical protein